MSEEFIKIRDVSFSYGKTQVLDQLSLTISSGTSFGLLGPNGAGKTTLFYLLLGLLKPSSGSINLMSRPASHNNAAFIGYMPQSSALYQDLTVYENLDFFARIYNINDHKERRNRINQILETVELSDRAGSQIFKLSGGMRQRLSLACALVHNPKLLILDEPTAGIDPELRASFWTHFNGLLKQGVTIVISSHTMDDAIHCDQLAFIRMGKTIAQGTPPELCRATGSPKASLEDAFLYFAGRGKN